MNILLAIFRGIFGSPIPRHDQGTNSMQPTLTCIKQAKLDQKDKAAYLSSGQELRMELEEASSPMKPVVDERDVDDWKNILENEDSSHPEYEKAFNEVLKDANSVEEFVWLYDQIGPDSKLLPALIQAMESHEDTFDAWCESYENMVSVDAFSDHLLRRALENVKSPDEWVSIWKVADNSGNKDAKVVFDALDRAGLTKDKLEEVCDEVNNDTEDCTALTDYLLIKLLEFRTTPVEISEFYIKYEDEYNVDDEDEVASAIFKKLFSVATRQEVQLISIFTEKDILRDAADKFLKS